MKNLSEANSQLILKLVMNIFMESKSLSIQPAYLLLT